MPGTPTPYRDATRSQGPRAIAPARRLAGMRAGMLAGMLAATLAAACGGGASRGGGPAAAPPPERPVQRAEELFSGRFPGVQVYQGAGGLIIRVRGASSNGGEPLYVIDGFPRQPGSGGLIDINPNDIAKIEVLKDAVSMAEYGSRGGNGVVRITTKRGPAPKS